MSLYLARVLAVALLSAVPAHASVPASGQDFSGASCAGTAIREYAATLPTSRAASSSECVDVPGVVSFRNGWCDTSSSTPYYKRTRYYGPNCIGASWNEVVPAGGTCHVWPGGVESGRLHCGSGSTSSPSPSSPSPSSSSCMCSGFEIGDRVTYRDSSDFGQGYASNERAPNREEMDSCIVIGMRAGDSPGESELAFECDYDSGADYDSFCRTLTCGSCSSSRRKSFWAVSCSRVTKPGDVEGDEGGSSIAIVAGAGGGGAALLIIVLVAVFAVSKTGTPPPATPSTPPPGSVPKKQAQAGPSSSATTSTTVKASDEPNSTVTKLKELKELLDMGVLDQAEFDTQKMKILAEGGTPPMVQATAPPVAVAVAVAVAAPEAEIVDIV